ncbi:hypothetical protein CERZMDRAFT_86602 [Cercospora zeae-maydis SCOH1-5]|uniref:Uncharacterized protein n=1 Tax=Cercospora zeae-maydis SCOH1-5 TaxID=717836 RepID=A0A6A6F9A0_9PEZI|nr:hypothetical protein CERZMDRAFT_86602 [Cercospora zeae-maydis SCOH1-5]
MAEPGRQVLHFIWLVILVLCALWYANIGLAVIDDDVPARRINSRINSPHLSKRIPAEGLSFEEWAARGRKLMQYMEEGSLQRLYQTMLSDGVLSRAQIVQCSSQSVFTNYNDLRENGWERNPPGYWQPDLANLEGDVYVLDVFRRLGISTSVRKTDNPTGDNEAATDAIYKVIYNTKDGVMTGMNKLSPTESRNEQYGDAWRQEHQLQIPDLHRSSDVVSLEWGELCRRNGHRSQGLRYYFSDSITNDETLGILNIVLQRKGYDPRNVDKHDDIFARPW